MGPKTTRQLLLTTLLLTALACCAVRPGQLWSATSAAPSAQTGVATEPRLDPAFHVDMKRSVEYLASDDLQGRLIGTSGIEKAADYVAGTFSKLGLHTLPGFDGYFQPFKMITRVDPDPAATALTINGQPLKLGSDFVTLRASSEGSAGGPVVFAGYSISDPAKHYDDYAAIDAKGKVVLAMRFEPHDAKGNSRLAEKDEGWSLDATIPRKVKAAVDHGAAAVVLVNPPRFHDDEGLIPFFRRFGFGASIPVAQVTVDTANRILKAGGADDLKSLQSRIDQDLKPDGVALTNVAVHLSAGILKAEAQVENVGALLPGKGPRADEYVIVGAHYDHLGHGGPGSLSPWSHGIHHGADDNASGTTAMTAIADRLAHEGPQARSIIFIAFTGEEEGLFGSAHFTGHPPVPLDHVVAMLNLDMVGRVSNEKLLIGGKGTAADFPVLVEKADEGLPLKLGEFGKGGIGPSDHMSFALRKIPVLFFFSGMHLDYHRPTDTADKINYQGMEQVVELGVRVVKSMATMPRQVYNAGYDASGLLLSADASSGSHGGGASMGAIPDYTQDEDAKEGMRIGGIMPDSPAARLGLKQGDLITEFNGTKIANMIDYTNALAKAKPGQQVKLKALRDGKPMDLEATLAARKG